jgi:putative membrane protein
MKSDLAEPIRAAEDCAASTAGYQPGWRWAPIILKRPEGVFGRWQGKWEPEMYKRFIEVGVLAMCALAVGGAHAAEKLSDAEKNFMSKAAQGNLFEIRSGELAQKKTTNDDVRKLAVRLAADHSANNTELKKLAAKYGFELPNEPDPKQHKQMERLEKLSGPEFDRTYVELLMEDHKGAIALFEKQVKSSTGDVKEYAEKSLPVLREHLKLVEETRKKLG